MKRFIVVLLCLLLSVSAIPLTVTADSEVVNLTWFTEAAQDESLAATQEYLLGPFHEKFPNIRITQQPTPDWNQALKVQMAAGQGPDIFNMDGSNVMGEYQKADRILDISLYVEKYGWDDIIFEWALGACKIGDKVYGLPNSYEGLVLWINEDMFAANGWTVPKTYAELEALCTDIQGKGIIPFAFGSSGYPKAMNWWACTVLSNYLGREKLRSILVGDEKWTDPLVPEAFERWLDMNDRGWINEGKSMAISGDDATALFAQQKAAMKMEGTWLYGTLLNMDLDFQPGCYVFPSLREGVAQAMPLALGGVVGVNNKTPYPDECAEFLNFMFTEIELSAKGIESAGFQSLPVDYPEGIFSSNMDPLLRGMIDEMNDYMDQGNIGYCNWSFWPIQTKAFMDDNSPKLLLREITPVEYAQGIENLFEQEKAAGMLPIVP